MININSLSPMVADYLVAMLWCGVSESETEPNYSCAIIDCAEKTIAKAEADCANFKEMISPFLDEYLKTQNYAQMGHDFWLTRNGHGAGFWDRGLGELGLQLTKISKSFGELSPYLGDDKKVYTQCA